MTTIITQLLEAATWELIFSTAFFFGLLFFLLVIFGSFGHHGDDVGDSDAFDSTGDGLDLDGDGIPDGIDLDGDGTLDIHFDGNMDVHGAIDLDGDGIPDGIDLDGDGIIDTMHGSLDHDISHDMGHNFDHGSHDFGHDMSHDISHDLSGDHDGFDRHIQLNETVHADKADEEPVCVSKYKMGNISSFMFFFGMVGWPFAGHLEDQHVVLAVLVGFLASRLFAYFIANYTRTVIVPLQPIRRGDIAQVRYSVTPEKAGMVTVIRRDGVISTEMAKGAFPHDHFDKGEKGYIWNKQNGFLLITRGVQGQPDLNSEQQPSKKKALDF